MTNLFETQRIYVVPMINAMFYQRAFKPIMPIRWFRMMSPVLGYTYLQRTYAIQWMPDLPIKAYWIR
jgi:hypothetical protein